MAKTQSNLLGDMQRHWKQLPALIAMLLVSVGGYAESNSCGQTDALAAAATNAQIEGDDAASGTSTPTVRLNNYCQISSKYAVVTDTQNAVNTAGRKNEMAYQISKRLGELKRKQHCAFMV